MSIGASIVCVADGKMPGLIAALRAGIRYPVIEMRPEDAPTRLAAIQPAAVVVDKPNTDLELIETIVGRVGKLEGPYVPVLARSADGACDQPSSCRSHPMRPRRASWRASPRRCGCGRCM